MIKDKLKMKLKCPRLLLWLMCSCWFAVTSIALAVESPKEVEATNPIYVMSLIITMLFMVSCFFLGKWIHTQETEINELKKVQNENCMTLNKLLTEHNLMKERCGGRF